jgi:hypothetical protein
MQELEQGQHAGGRSGHAQKFSGDTGPFLSGIDPSLRGGTEPQGKEITMDFVSIRVITDDVALPYQYGM